MSEACHTCRFWKLATSDEYGGEEWTPGICRREPPRMMDSLVAMHVVPPALLAEIDLASNLQPFAIASRYPVTFGFDWCGRFESRAPEMPVC